MARRPDLPCSRCGKLLYRSSTTLPEGQATCRECRRHNLQPPRELPSRACSVCGNAFTSKHAETATCSRTCRALKRYGRTAEATRKRTCEVCSAEYKASCPEQRTCGRVCGVTLRRSVTGTLAADPKPIVYPSCKVWAKDCAHCARPFTARQESSVYCSTPCRKAAHPYQSKRKPRACNECGATIPTTAYWTVRYCSDDCKRVSNLVADRAQRSRERQAGKREGTHRARARRFGVEYEPVVKRRVYDRDGWRCQLCRRKVNRGLSWPDPMSASLDHVIPMSRGGGHTYSNCQLAHLSCNVDKGNAGSGEQLALIG